MSEAKKFKDFFYNIDEELWCTDYYTTTDGRCCALGHLGFRNNGPSLLGSSFESLAKMVGVSVLNVNDIRNYKGYDQATPKQRILALCDDLIKAGY